MKNYYCFIVLLFLLSCNQTPKKVSFVNSDEDTASHFSIKNGVIPIDFDYPEQASVFDYFKAIELIPLETGDDVLIRGISQFVHHQDRYYALDMSQSIVFVFDLQGKYIFKINKRGQGPGEYAFLEDIHINPFTGYLELLSPAGLVYEYDLKGKFVKMTRVVYEDFRAVHRLITMEKNISVFITCFEPTKIIYYDLSKGELLLREFEEDRLLGAYGCTTYYKYNNDWYFYRPFHTHVYKLGKEHLEDSYRWDFGKYTREGRKVTYSESARRGNTYDETLAQFSYWIRKVGENNRYVIAQIQRDEKMTNAIYDKSLQKGKFIDGFTESVLLNPIIVTNDYVLSYCNDGELHNYITEQMLDEKNRQILEDLKNAEDEQNPVIIKYYFK